MEPPSLETLTLEPSTDPVSLVKLPLDCLSLIAEWLCYVDIMSLRMTCRAAQVLSPPSFRRLFMRRLLRQPLVEHPAHRPADSPQNKTKLAERFCEALFETGAFVSGSFILDCLYDTDFHSDIDIYDQADPTKPYRERSDFEFGENSVRFTQFLYRSRFINADNAIYQGTTYVIRKYIHRDGLGGTVSGASTNNELQEFAATYRHCIQIIPIALQKRPGERSVIPRSILGSFDLDICKCAFNGRMLLVRSWKKMIERRDYICPNTRFLISIYPFNNDHDQETTDSRMKKYIARGFKITPHPQTAEIQASIVKVLATLRYPLLPDHPARQQDKIRYLDDGSINLDRYSIDC